MAASYYRHDISEPYLDGLCRLNDKFYSKCIEFEDVNYQLAGADDKTAVFENLCDFYNYYYASIGIQLSIHGGYASLRYGTRRQG